jgi:hypothetical protein
MIWILLAVVVVGGLVYWHTVIAVTFASLLGVSLLVGAPLFWLLCLVETGLIFWYLDTDDDDAVGVVATAALLIVLGLFQLFGNFKVFTWIWQHPGWAVMSVAGYLVAGGGWSIAKWWFEETNSFRKAREAFLWQHGIKGLVIPSEFRDRWSAHVQSLKSDPSRQQRRFVAWIGYWPWSLTWTLCNNALKRACRRIYYELLALYQRITDHVWRIE